MDNNTPTGPPQIPETLLTAAQGLLREVELWDDRQAQAAGHLNAKQARQAAAERVQALITNSGYSLPPIDERTPSQRMFDGVNKLSDLHTAPPNPETGWPSLLAAKRDLWQNSAANASPF